MSGPSRSQPTAQNAQSIGAELLETATAMNAIAVGLSDTQVRRALIGEIRRVITLSNRLAKLASDLSVSKG